MPRLNRKQVTFTTPKSLRDFLIAKGKPGAIAVNHNSKRGIKKPGL
jgi:hypothetical protein